MADEERQTFVIRFVDESMADAGKKVKALRQDLLSISPKVEVEIRKDDPSTMDFGTTLVLVLGTTAVTALARGIADYLRRDRAAIEISAGGRVVASNVSGSDAARIAEAFAQVDGSESSNTSAT